MLTKTQSIVRMAVEIGRAGSVPAAKAIPMARTAYGAFEQVIGVAIGADGWSWNEAAAVTLAHEYEIACW